ncbi:hypothetical protein AQJ54_41085 [Streptomyces griseorubiginosus]|uniref:Uncharacterized protein n=2 Tax=Streptomyces griseorubiginosus TaxID=67304 RepID=A0A124HVL2_9ACTN|nr:hypothetical protein AQJ54_41085 [Streptomyces griseorubiginosus]
MRTPEWRDLGGLRKESFTRSNSHVRARPAHRGTLLEYGRLGSMACQVPRRKRYVGAAGRRVGPQTDVGRLGPARRPRRARLSGGIVDGMQMLTVLEWALAALAGLRLVLCALVTVDSAR